MNTVSPRIFRTLGAVLLALLAFAFPATASASTPTSATISIEVIGTPSLKDGTSFDLRVWTSNNDSGTTPSGANVRLVFDNNIINPTAANAPDLTDFIVAKSNAVGGTSPNNYIDVFISAPSNDSLEPELAVIEFDVIGTGTFSIGLEADPNYTNPFLNTTPTTLPNFPFFELVVTPINVGFDDSATQNLEALTTVLGWEMID